MSEFWTKLPAYIAAITAAAFVLNVFFQVGVFFVFGIDLLQLFSAADFINTSIHWLPLISATLLAIPLLPLAIISSGEFWAGRDKPVFSWRSSLVLPRRLRVAMDVLYFGVLPIISFVFTILVFKQIGEIYAVTHRHEVAATVPSLFNGLVFYGISFIGIAAICALRLWVLKKYVLLYYCLCICLVILASTMGLMRGLSLIGGNGAEVTLTCREIECSGNYKLAYLLSDYVVVVSSGRKIRGVAEKIYYVEVIPRSEIKKITRVDAMLEGI